MKKRYLFNHPESDSLFEEYLSKEEYFSFYGTLDGAHCDDVTGLGFWEEEFYKQQRALMPENKGKDMMNKIALRGFLLAIAAAFSELAGSFDAEDSAEVSSEETPKTEKKARKPRASKAKAAPEPEPEIEEDETEEVESPYEDVEVEETEEDDFAGMEEDEEEETPKAPTTEDLRTALVAYATAHGKPKAYEILAKFKGAKKAVDVKGADIAKAIKMLEVKKGKK